MVLIFGIAPELHAEVYCSETKKHVEDFSIYKVSCNDEIKSMYAHLKSSAIKPFSNDFNLGTICICIGDLKYVSYDYNNNNIRKMLIENGLAAGFKAVEIIDTCTAMFFDAIKQSHFYPKKDGVIWIHNYGTWYIWKVINDSIQLIFCEKPNDNTWITEDLIHKYLEKSQKNPDAIIYGHQVREYLFDYFRSRYNLHIFDSFNFVSGALEKAKIMAGKTKQINALNLLGRDLKLFVGKNEILHFEQYQTAPVGKVLRVKKNANDLALKIIDGSCKEKIPLPATTACVIVIEIDGNGIDKISVIDESVAKLIQQNDFEEIKCSA